MTGPRVWLLLVIALTAGVSADRVMASRPALGRDATPWVGTWAAAAQPNQPANLQTFANQSLRLVVHVSAGGTKVRIHVSNTFGDRPLVVGAARVARRTSGADIDPTSDRALTFDGRSSTTVAAGSTVASDGVDLDVPALSDLAISLFLPQPTTATTIHILAKQTNYVSGDAGDCTAAVRFPVAKTIRAWPFLTGVDVAAPPGASAVVAFGSSLTDGDGTTADGNRRWPDVLAQRLQTSGGGNANIGVLNEGIIGNRLLKDSPAASDLPFGRSLGEAGVARFDRDVLGQAGVGCVVVGIGINDIAFPGSLTPAVEAVSAESLIAGYRQIIARARRQRVRVIGTTNPPFEGAFLALSKTGPPIRFYTPDKEDVRRKVNAWIRDSGEFDAVVDLDLVLRDPDHPTRLLPAYDSGDHVHPNDAGALAEANAIPLALLVGR